MRQLNLSHLAPRKGLNTFVCETTFRCSCASRTTCAASTSRSRTVDLRSDRPAGVYETIRYGRDAFIYHHRGSWHSPALPLISKTRGFAAPVAKLACEFSAGAGRSTCVQTALHRAYETVRHGRDDFIAPHRGSRHWSSSRSSAKHGGFAQQARHAAAPLREPLP